MNLVYFGHVSQACIEITMSSKNFGARPETVRESKGLAGTQRLSRPFRRPYALSTQAAGPARDHRLPYLPDTCPEATAAADATSDASGSGMFDATPVTRVPARISFEVAS